MLLPTTTRKHLHQSYRFRAQAVVLLLFLTFVSTLSAPSHALIMPKSASVTATSRQSNAANDASALRELKETIRKQQGEIKALQAALLKAAPTAKSSHGGGHHGPPTDSNTDLYLSSPFYKLALQRVGWLAIFLCSLSLTAVIMNGFEHTLSKQIELAYFVPLLAGHGGNTGGQAVGSVLTALSSGNVCSKDALRIIRKEAMSGITVGLILGSIVGPLAYYIGGISRHVSMVVFCTLPLLSTIAATLASTIPFVAKGLGLDPAIIAAPAMTTFVDVSGLLSYFLIANKIFKWYGLEL